MESEFRSIVKVEVDKAIRKLPSAKNSLKGLSERMRVFNNELEPLSNRVTDLANEFLDKNGKNDENIAMVKKVGSEEIKRFISHFNK